MTDGAGLQQEFELFFGKLTVALDAAEESRSGIDAGLQHELEAFFGKLTLEVEAEVRAATERHGQRGAELQQDLTRMFRLLEPTITAATVAIKVMEERERDELDRRTGRNFSAFDLVKMQELDLSRVFGGLLDPSGNHAHGDLFLSLLLEELNAAPRRDGEMLRNFQPPGGVSARMRLEHWTDKINIPGAGKLPGSIDIVLEIEGNRWIGIENKPSAPDQPWQVDRYLIALLEEVEQRGGEEEQLLLLYWSGDGSGPDLPELKMPPWDEKHKARQERLRSRCLTVHYRKRFGVPSVEGWLKRCWVESESDRVRAFLHDLLDFVQRRYKHSHSS